MSPPHERRRSPRRVVPEGAAALIRSTIRVQLVDLSLHGARFQVSAPLRPGTVYALSTRLGSLSLDVPVRITRCRAGGYAKDGRGGQVLLFQAGAEFLWEGNGPDGRLAEWLESGPPVSPGTTADLVP